MLKMKSPLFMMLLLAMGLTQTGVAQDNVFDAIVAQDGTGTFTNIQDAIDASRNSADIPYVILIKEGRYHEHIFIPEHKRNLRFIGQGREKVRIFDDRITGGKNGAPVDVAATGVCHASDIYFEGLTFENTWGTRQNDGPQALALYTKGDRITLNHCAMLSYQDTYRTSEMVNGRNFVNDCLIEGAVDFLYGQGNVFFNNCTLNIVRKKGGFIVATKHDDATTWGYVLKNTRITAPGNPSETEVWLGRPWIHGPKVVFIDTRSEVTIPAKGWYDHMSTLPKIHAEYNTMDGNGKPLDLSQRINRYYKLVNNDTIWGTAKNLLTRDEAAKYTIANVLRGDDNWQPEADATAPASPDVKQKGQMLTWKAVNGARGYIVEREGKVVCITTQLSYTLPDKHKYTVRTVGTKGNLSGYSSR